MMKKALLRTVFLIVCAGAAIWVFFIQKFEKLSTDSIKTELFDVLPYCGSWRARHAKQCLVVDMRDYVGTLAPVLQRMDLEECHANFNVYTEWATALLGEKVSANEMEAIFFSTRSGSKVLLVHKPIAGRGRRLIFIYEPL